MERLYNISADIGRIAACTEQLKQSGIRKKKIMDEVRNRYNEASEKYFNSLEGPEGMTYRMGSQYRYKQVAMRELKDLKDARKKWLDASGKYYESLEVLESMREMYKGTIRNYAKSFNPKEIKCETEADIYRFYCLSIVAEYKGDALIPEEKAGSEWFKHVRGLKLHAKLLRPSGERVRVEESVVRQPQLHSGQGQPSSSSSSMPPPPSMPSTAEATTIASTAAPSSLPPRLQAPDSPNTMSKNENLNQQKLLDHHTRRDK